MHTSHLNTFLGVTKCFSTTRSIPNHAMRRALPHDESMPSLCRGDRALVGSLGALLHLNRHHATESDVARAGVGLALAAPAGHVARAILVIAQKRATLHHALVGAGFRVALG